MGFYVNPDTETKESFLAREGTCTTQPTSYDSIPKDKAAICLVDNGTFSAAAVAYSQRELEAFTYDDDTRKKQWFLVDREKLNGVSNIEAKHFD